VLRAGVVSRVHDSFNEIARPGLYEAARFRRFAALLTRELVVDWCGES